MSQKTVAIVVGSIRKDSFNRQFAEALVKQFPADLKPQFIRIDDLPLYDQDDDGNAAPPVARLRQEIKAADAVLFVTPEYNRSFPGVLKNAIDHASRPWGQSVWTGKPTAVCGVSVGVIGTALAQQHLRNVLAYLNMPTLGGNEMFIQWKDGLVQDGAIGAASKDFVQKFVDAFAAWVKQNAA
ncbi:NADPH-dependent FMN reductase [Ottowia sp.]|uniref:NADPH-dependent FMN reductase n=1 Tax=Ottowia sp. TaxID=1898956 RepID=UPI002B8FC04C|nr:NADPH-dependent FMN reductase [Ottowia sp.]HOB65566.1 NADPH-dependent FMN reductase [Ottowia sp.]HPZ56625.1 NADPH-dependent FMN reductase [Ottowia sp.]HQD46668.1 NADPH-dependent FMN reductase [Ottowia sp.]